MPDLAPTIFRQRLVIEGLCPAPIVEEQMSLYLRTLSHVCGMRQLAEPVSHRSERYGWAGWIHWENSGAHFYAWDSPEPFFSVDIYTCKEFDADRACEFTRSFFGALKIAALTF
jgi:S-adenosylmethionine decarboxylase